MKLLLRVTSLLLFIICVIWWSYSPGFDALTALVGGVITLFTSFIVERKKDQEIIDQRDRSMMLVHVENFWVKGILDKSLYGAALLDLGMKEDLDALKYPWAIHREATEETIPKGTSMLEIFEQVGLGRSLLILGAPGSGKTTMLLELTHQLIERARNDAMEPIPIVFNLSSWTARLSLADWLAQELNIFYSIPKKLAPGWVKDKKMLLLLDGLDEVKQEVRDRCVDAINQFKQENGQTSIVVSSRSEEYSRLKQKLALYGAIEIQPLTPRQVKDYFQRFGRKLAGIKNLLENDTVLREMAESPLFLSIMTLAYRDTEMSQIRVSKNFDEQRKYLFDTYIERMFKRPERSKNEGGKRQDVLQWLPWLAHKMIEHNQVPFLVERIQPSWLDQRKQAIRHRLISALLGGLAFGPPIGLAFGLLGGLSDGLSYGLAFGLLGGLRVGLADKIETVDQLTWNSKGLPHGLVFGLVGGLVGGISYGQFIGLRDGLVIGLLVGLLSGLFGGLYGGLQTKQVEVITRPGERLFLSTKNSLFVLLLVGLLGVLLARLRFGWLDGWLVSLPYGLLFGLPFGMIFGGQSLFQHYSLRFVLSKNNLLPWKLIPFLNRCADLIFLRQVGSGYIFVHRLLMEHFAAMYTEKAKS